MPFLWPGRGGSAVNYISGAPTDFFCAKTPRRIAILGSTGSIGRNALAIVENSPGFFLISGLAAGSNIKLLAAQANRHRPAMLAVKDHTLIEPLRSLLDSGYNPQIAYGQVGYGEMASMPEADGIVSAQAGSAGLCGTLAAALTGKVVFLANKESLVIAGDLVRHICAKTGASILPVDSEHYAIFQCLAGHGQQVDTLLLTASGGPFLGKTRAEMEHMAASDALKHPNWSMGAKITIDSATLMNKGLEVVEAMRLYGLDSDRIEVLVHPQSIVHSLVRFADNSILAQLATPDMRLPLGACMRWPHADHAFIKPLDLTQIGALTFKAPASENFPCLALARNAAKHIPCGAWAKSGLSPACIVLNAANETAVDIFLSGKCSFGAIAPMVAHAMSILSSPEALPDPELPEAPTGSWRDALAIIRGIMPLQALAQKMALQWLENHKSA